MTSKKLSQFVVKYVYFIFVALLSQNLSYADNSSQNLPEISEKLGSKIDLDLQFKDDSGINKTIRDMFEDQNTLIITLNYFRCTTMCTYQLMNLSESLKKMNLPVGKGYTVASISFDPTDDTQRAQTIREIWLKQLGARDIPWHFYTSTNPSVAETLAKSLNFYFEKDDEGNYSHTAGLFFIDKSGTFKRYVYGIVYEPRDIKYAIIDTSKGVAGSFFDKILMKFTKYNATRGKYEFYGS